jgi:hypothetical protein
MKYPPVFLVALHLVLILFSGTGLFGATPPSELTGEFLYFEEGPDDFLIFSNATNGEERDLAGDVDPFTYVYTITGPATATLTVTYDPEDGDYEEWDLTWNTNGKGTFVRREYRDSILRDTDTGQFHENTEASFPPADLIGARLEEAVELEDERFEFLTDTIGREFEPGDIDPFTYTYGVSGADTADLIATFKADKWDELDLTFETAATGTYVLRRFDDNLLKDEKRGEFRLAGNTHVVDLAVGESRSTLVGDNYFNASGARQTVGITTRKNSGSTSIIARAENDGDSDSFTIRASKGNRRFAVQYLSTSPRRNVTSKITRGRGYKVEQLNHGQASVLQVQARPKGSRGGLTLRIRGSSESVRGAVDQARVKLRKK